ncbi:MAG: T9SS type A sorting domain-containing protein [bacterium]|nr:T9SS type A sorting domain-containing protein [bacterium]
MKHVLTALLHSLTFIAVAQPFEIGHTTITFNDPNRTGGFGSGGGPGRQIQTEIYYPADVAGTDVNVAIGEYPVIVFGHGFAMVWDAYANIWETLVPEGFIVAFPRTEGGLSPSHDEFGMDLALLADEVQLLSSDPTSLFYNQILSKTAVMGHSMGGGATMIAAENNTNVTTIIGLAPAETTPSAIQAATNINVPALIFSADEDAVTPAASHHTPIYDNLNSTCKYFVNILGGGHCYYANSNFNCDFGEASSGGNITITRQEQQDIMFRYVLPWLNLYLKTMCPEADVFTTDLPLDGDVSYQSSCSSGFPSYDNGVVTNGATLTAMQVNTDYQWLDCDNNYAVIQGETGQDFVPTQDGNYAVQIGSSTCIDTSACIAFTLVGTSELFTSQIHVYPNPSEGIFTIEMQKEGTYSLHNSQGKRLLLGSLTQGENIVAPQLNAGVYLLEITSENQATYIQQIVLR